MNTRIKLAQISDIHISAEGDERIMMSTAAERFLAETVQTLNAQADLDFVFFSGDCLNYAYKSELAHFEAIYTRLQKPAYLVPGNHDGNLSKDPEIIDQRQFAERFNPQFGQRPGQGQAGYFSVEIKPGVQFIGLDSSITGQTGGEIDAAQLIWLEGELTAHSDKLIIIGCHHPFHPLCEADLSGIWKEWFVCANGPEVQTLLDSHPAVKVVLCGHHHVNKVFWQGGQVHLAAPPLVSYPCAYRELWLEQAGDDWRIGWQTINMPPHIQAEAAHRLRESDFALMFDPLSGSGQAFVDFAEGDALSKGYEGTLSELNNLLKA